MVCERLEIFTIVEVFFSFYAIRLSKGCWVTLDGMVRKAPFKPHSNYYNNFKDKFSQVRGLEGSRIVVGTDGVPLFPLAWTDKLEAIVGYDDKYLTHRMTIIVLLLKKFEVMDSCTMIEL